MKRISILFLMAAAMLAYTACSPDSDSYTGIIDSDEEENNNIYAQYDTTVEIDDTLLD